MSTNRPQRPPRTSGETRRERPARDPELDMDVEERPVRRERPVREGQARADRMSSEQRPRREGRAVREERTARESRPRRERPVREDRPARQMPSVDLSGIDLSASAIQKGIAELIGTFLLVFIGVASVIQGTGFAPFAFGMALLVIVYALGHISGAHVNPAVTLGLAATGNFSWALAPVYWVMQVIGAILAALMLKLTFDPSKEMGMGVTHLADGVDVWRGFLLEMICTAILVFVVHAVATDKRAPAAVSGLATGFALFGIAIVAGGMTGGSFNPAVSIGPALVDTDFGDLWLYIVAPLLGGVLGGFLYQIISRDDVEVDPSQHPTEAIN